MPCRDYDATDYGFLEDLNKRQRKIDSLTRMLCGVLTQLEELNFDDEKGQSIITEVKGLYKWWETHKELDARRRKQEQVANEEKKKKRRNIRSAVKKLTAVELDALKEHLKGK